MQNPFKTVYCKDCEFCMLDETFQDDKSLEYARCKNSPKGGDTERAMGLARPIDYYFCSTYRVFGFKFCFRYKEAKND